MKQVTVSVSLFSKSQHNFLSLPTDLKTSGEKVGE